MDDQTNKQRYQPDPFLREGRSGSGWVWIVGGIIAVALIVTFFTITGRSNHVAVQQHATPITTGASDKPPATAQPTGRVSGHEARTGEQTKIQ